MIILEIKFLKKELWFGAAIWCKNKYWYYLFSFNNPTNRCFQCVASNSIENFILTARLEIQN